MRAIRRRTGEMDANDTWSAHVTDDPFVNEDTDLPADPGEKGGRYGQYGRHYNEDDPTYARRLAREAVNRLEQAQRIAQGAADDAARRIANEREGAPVVTIGLDTPITRIPRYSGDPDEEPEDAETLRDIIIERAASQLSHASKDVTAKVRARTLEMVEEGMREEVDRLIEETLNNPIQQTNQWGEPTGQPTTLRALVIKEAHDWLVRGSSRDTFADRRDGEKKASAAVLVKDLVESVMSRELSKEVETAKAMVKERVQTTSAAVIAKAVTDGLQLGGR